VSESADDQRWWRDRLWGLRDEVSGHHQRLVALDDRAKDQEKDLRDLDTRTAVAFRELRQEHRSDHLELKRLIEVNIGALRADVQAMDNTRANDAKPFPMKWAVLLACVVIVAVASASFGVGAAWNSQDSRSIAADIVTP
jgi:hypothetical protein